MRAGAQLIAVPAAEVEAAAQDLTPTPLPFTPPTVRGVVSLRGRVFTVLDAALLLAAAGPAPTSPPNNNSPDTIVALRGDEQFALAVEGLEGRLETHAGVTVEAPAALPPLVRYVVEDGGRSILLLDTARLFDAALRGAERRRRRT